MLTEILIYIALFSTLFSGAFLATSQCIDGLHYLEDKKDVLDAENFLTLQIDQLLQKSSKWQIGHNGDLQFSQKDSLGTMRSYDLYLSNKNLLLECLDCLPVFKRPLSGSLLPVNYFSALIAYTPTSTEKVLEIYLTISNVVYPFSYYVEK